MANYSDVVMRWLDIVMGRTDKRNYSNPRMYGDGDAMYSYGRHFELGRVLRDRKRQPRMFLLNGDRFSPTTTKHQNEIRWGVQREGLPVVTIPFSALDSAGIDRDTVELIEETGDRHETIHHTSFEKPPRAVWDEQPIYKYNDPLTADEVAEILARRNADELESWQRRHQYAQEEVAEGRERRVWASYLDPESKPKVQTVDDIPQYQRTVTRQVGTRKVLRSAPKSHRLIDFEHLPDGRTRYSWDTTRHWLGESLIRAKIPTVGWSPCKTCNGNGRILPDPLASLPPDLHGDAFWAARERAQEHGMCKACRGRGTRRWTRNRTAFFLSGFDHNETWPVYFFCELPRGVHPTSVAEAYEALKPEPVRLAEQMGRTIHRQGDIFAIELRDVDRRELRKRGARFEKRGNLLNTNHEATEVAYLPDGTTLVRGTLWHNPAWRRPDHRRVTVGKSWHIAIKNTVPVAA